VTPPRAYFAACGALIGFAFGYALPVYAHLPNLHYDPLAHRFLIAAQAGRIPIGYYGQLLWGAGGAAVAGAIGALLGRTRRGDQALLLAAAWTLSAIAIVGAWFAWNNWP
jgi:hypothetical protein